MTHPLNNYFDKILVLTTNHKFSLGRRERVVDRLKDVNFDFFYGVYSDEVDIDYYRENGMGANFSEGQICCSLSHLKIYDYIIRENIDKCLILEDDSILSATEEQLTDCISDLPKDWQLFYPGYTVYQNIQPNFSKNLYKFSRNNYTIVDQTYAYAVRQSTAQKLFNHNQNIRETADGMIRQFLLTEDIDVYVSIPKLFIHEGMDSIIENIDNN